MQLLAKDEKKRSVLSTDAIKRKDYSCPECSSIVRLRQGPHRKPHFFHLSSSPTCRQHQKSRAHLRLQLYIQALLPDGEATLERRFPAISRIADVAWEAEQIVFEIQCSHISQEEASARCRDYNSLGLTPVWILHTHRYNKNFLSAAENYLRKNHCFFSNFDRQGKWLIYDQFEIIQGGRRHYRSRPLPVDLTRPIRHRTHLTFHGALPHRLECDPTLSTLFIEKEKQFQKTTPPFFNKMSTAYTTLLHLFLEILAK